jgi:hypothetical protein
VKSQTVASSAVAPRFARCGAKKIGKTSARLIGGRLFSRSFLLHYAGRRPARDCRDRDFAGLFVVPPYQISPEDNLSYVDFVRLHQQAAEKIAAFPEARVLTAWPASDELTRPYLGYVSHPVPVVQIQNFTLGELSRARRQDGDYNCALVFSSKFQPSHPFLPAWWERLQTRFFDYHRDLPPEAAAQVLGGNILYEAHRGGEWVAIIAAGTAMETENAKLK